MQAYRNVRLNSKLNTLVNELKKNSIRFTKVDDFSLRIYDTFTLVIVSNREAASAFTADDVHYITASAIDSSLPGLIAFVQKKLSEAQQVQHQEQMPTWKPLHNKKEIRRNTCIKTKVDPATLQTSASNRKPIGMSQREWERLQGV